MDIHCFFIIHVNMKLSFIHVNMKQSANNGWSEEVLLNADQQYKSR